MSEDRRDIEKLGINYKLVLRSDSFSTKHPPENQPSLLLQPEENETIFSLLGEGCNTLSTAVVQLLTSYPDESKWENEGTGVACFVRDQAQKSYFIQVFCLKTCGVIFCQELYRQFEFHTPHPFLVTFEAENKVVGLNFADMIEASNFRRALHDNLEKKRLRLEMRRSIMMKVQESKMAKQCEQFKPTTVTTKVQNMVRESTNNKKGKDGKTIDLGYVMFCKRMEQIGLE